MSTPTFFQLYRSIVLSLVLLMAVAGSAQFEERRSYVLSAFVTPSFSFGGLNTELGVHLTKDRHLVGAAYRAIPSESRIFSRVQHGFSLRYTRYLLENDLWKMGLHGRVFQSFGLGQNRQGEYLIGQQLDCLISQKWTVGLSMAAGMYEERLVDERYGITVNDFGASGMVGVELHYRLSR